VIVYESPLPSPDPRSVPNALLRLHLNPELGPYNVRVSIPEREQTSEKCVSFCGGMILVEMADDGTFLALQLQDLPTPKDDPKPFVQFLNGVKEHRLVYASFLIAKLAWSDFEKIAKLMPAPMELSTIYATRSRSSSKVDPEEAFAGCS